MDTPERPDGEAPDPSKPESSPRRVEREPPPNAIIKPVTPAPGEDEENLRRRREWFHKRTGR